ncbi:MAG: DUF998 domain-containing protein [Methanomassiliicoccales archaeon]|nr:DUF998 domain-containing protein [Methanomassiliicoccales archaeon]NYT14914.1 DUF998 domain-containing protein [Methanomassiliicoccales archaeon]
MEKKNLMRTTAIIGLIGAILFALLWTSAVIADGNWVLGEETLSELGGDRPGRLYFNTGVIVMGIMGLLFAVGLFLILKEDLLGRIGTSVLFVGAVALIGVGIFPITTGEYHTFFSYAFFGLMLVTMFLLALPIWRECRLGPLGGIVTVGALAVSLVFLFTSSIPLTEAVAVICLLIWTVTISTLILTLPMRRKGFGAGN